MKPKIKLLVILGLILIAPLLRITRCEAIEVSIGYGQDIPIESWQTDGLGCSIISIEVSQTVNSYLYSSLVFHRAQGNLDSPQLIDGQAFSKSSNALLLNYRLGLFKSFGSWQSKLFGGFGLKSNHLPEIENSGVVGHFGGYIGYKIGQWNVGYEFLHISDPLRHGDRGWNMQFITLRRAF